MRYKMRNKTAILRLNSNQRIIGCINNRVVCTDLRKESSYSKRQWTAGIFADKECDRSVARNDFKCSMEKFTGRYSLSCHPVHLLPIAHAIGIGGTPLVSSTDKIVESIVTVLFCKFLCKGIRRLLNRDQSICEITVKIFIAVVITVKFMTKKENTVSSHKEF